MITGLISLLIILITAAVILLDFSENSSIFRAGLIFLSGLLLLGYQFQPNWWPTEEADAILLTSGAYPSKDGYSPRSSAVYSIEPREKTSSEAASWLSSAKMLSGLTRLGQTVEIYGYGTDEELPGQIHWIDKLSSPGSGVVITEAASQVYTGEMFTISGRWVNPGAKDSLNIYKDGSLLETLYPDEKGIFTFSDRLWTEGPVGYSLEWNGSDSVITEPLNIRAVTPESLDAAVLLYSPSYEITYLAEMLGEGGHSLSLRTRVGRDRFRFDEINTPPQDPETLFTDLSGFDLVILDPREYMELNAGERGVIKEALRKGLDLMLLPSEEQNMQPWMRTIADLTEVTIGAEPISRLEPRQWAPFGDNRQKRLPLLDVNFTGLSGDVQITGKFEQSTPVSIRIPAGSGSVSAHLHYQSYPWLLRGDAEAYNRFWSGTLEDMITLEAPFLGISKTIPAVHGEVMITSSSESIRVVNISGSEEIQLPVSFGDGHPGVGTARFWPTSAGWHRAESGEVSHWFYVYGNDQWEFSRDYSIYQNTTRQIAEQSGLDGTGRKSGRFKVPDWIWLCGFLLLQGILWAEKKLV